MREACWKVLTFLASVLLLCWLPVAVFVQGVSAMLEGWIDAAEINAVVARARRKAGGSKSWPRR